MSDVATTTTTTDAPAATSAAAALAGTPPAITAPAATTPPAAEAPAPAVDALSLPGKDATPEQWAEFYGKIGRPEKSADYGLKVRDGEDPAFVGEVADVMHKYGLTKDQANGLQNDLMAKAEARMQAAEQQRIAALDTKNKAEQAELKTELGDRFDSQMELAKRAVRQFAGTEQAADIITAIEDKLGYKATMQFFMGIGAGLGEHDANGQARQQADQGERPPTQKVLYG